MSERITLDNWDDGGALSRYAYQHTAEIFPAAVISSGTATAPLQLVPDPRIGNWILGEDDRGAVTLDRHVARSLADGLIVVHRGRIVHETYPRMMPDAPHLLFSVSKVFVGTLIALLEDRGLVALEATAASYLPRLMGTDWADVNVRDLLEMAAGMEGAEAGAAAYTDPLDHNYMLEASLGWLQKDPRHPDTVRAGDTWGYIADLRRIEAPGTRRVYTSVNTMILAGIVEAVTGKPLARVLSDELVRRMGAQHDALIAVSPQGLPIAAAGMQMTLRDLARFGLLFTPSWTEVAREPVIPPSVLARMQTEGRPELFGAAPGDWRRHGAYQWDAVTRDGDLIKGGFGNQMLFISPSRDLVVAWVGVNGARADDIDVDLPLQRMVEELF
ncbi:MAG TPA: serine hydrolase domain-containing protein [Pseudomonadales bacterium]|nr:serine hydrolase domain-containing protein [Pseudomonadales bacterium]